MTNQSVKALEELTSECYPPNIRIKQKLVEFADLAHSKKTVNRTECAPSKYYLPQICNPNQGKESGRDHLDMGQNCNNANPRVIDIYSRQTTLLLVM